jgi:hypothetical protein
MQWPGRGLWWADLSTLRARLTAIPARPATPTHNWAGRRALFGSAYHVVSVPAIMSVHDTIAIVSWIFMQTIVSRERAVMPPGVLSGTDSDERRQ